MNTNKDPLLEKNSIELDVLTEEGRGGEIKNKISSPKRSNLKKSPKHIEAVSYPQNDFFHDSSMEERKKPLNVESLGIISEENSAKNFANELSQIWIESEYCKLENNALAKTIINSDLDVLIYLTIGSAFLFALELYTLYWIYSLIFYFDQGIDDSVNLIHISLCLFGSKFLYFIIQKQYKMYQSNWSCKSILKLNCFIYDKMLKTIPSSTTKISTKLDIFNYISVESPKLGKFITNIPQIFIYSVKIAVFLFLLFRFLGISFLIGLATILSIIYINYYLLGELPRLQDLYIVSKEERMAYTTETLEEIRSIKIFSLENIFKDKIIDSRQKEIEIGKKLTYIKIIGIMLVWLSPVLALIFTIGIHQCFNDILNVNKIVICLFLFDMLQDPLRYLPLIYSEIMETLLALNKIEGYLKENEYNSNNIENNDYDDKVIVIKDLSFSWGYKIDELEDLYEDLKLINGFEEEDYEIESDEFDYYKNNVLKNINLSITQGEFVGIYGEVGSGKSSLIQAIMNNLIISVNENDAGDNGKEKENNQNINMNKILINGDMAYMSQIPWMNNDTIRNNILFFNAYDEKKYRETLNVCHLNDEIERFPEKDQTQIGENGSKLTLAIKAKICLARAVYQNSSIYLFDDPFGSLEKEEGDRIFSECLDSYLLNKTRVVATHNLKYLRHFDRIIWLNRGEITFNGNLGELLNQDFFVDFAQELIMLNSNQELKDRKPNNDKRKNIDDLNSVFSQNSDNKEKDILFTGNYQIVENITFLEGERKGKKNQKNQQNLLTQVNKEQEKEIEINNFPDKLISGKSLAFVTMENKKRVLNSQKEPDRRKSILSIRRIDNDVDKEKNLNLLNNPAARRKSILALKMPQREKDTKDFMTNNLHRKNSILPEKEIDVKNIINNINRRASVLNVKFADSEANIKNIMNSLNRRASIFNLKSMDKEADLKHILTALNRRASVLNSKFPDKGVDIKNIINTLNRRTSVLKVKITEKELQQINNNEKNQSCLSLVLIDKEKEDKINQEIVKGKRDITIFDTQNDQEEPNIFRSIGDEEEELLINKDVIIRYFNYMGGSKVFLLIFACVFGWQILSILSNLWLMQWTKLDAEENQHKFGYLIVYILLVVGGCAGILFQLGILSDRNLRCAQDLHDEMIRKVIKAPLSLYHDITPKAKLANTFSQDLDRVFDSILNIGSILIRVFTCLGCLFVISIFQFYSLIIIPFLIKYGLVVYRYFMNCSRDLQRLEFISWTKMSSFLSETYEGLISIRAFNKEKDYKMRFINIVDEIMKIENFSNGCFNWFNFYIEILIITFFLIILIFINVFEASFSPQAIGLIILYYTKLQIYILNVFVSIGTIKSDLTSMKKCLKLIDVPQESEGITEKDKYLIVASNEKDYSIKKTNSSDKEQIINFNNTNTKGWPNEGEIRFINYSIILRPDTPVVIDNISLTIKPREKVGIIGRNGSGKNLLGDSLLRLLEPLQGKILIDNEDISEIGLEKLRKNITIIPQMATIFKGTLRYNIDPSNDFKEEEIENVLNIVGYDYDGQDGIYKEITDALSFTEEDRQLISIARALLRDITININSQTEDKLQKLIFQCFKNKTLITIANKIKTITSYDKIIVMERGRILECDSPENLLSDKNSFFYKINSKS